MLRQPGIGKSACQPEIGDPDRSLVVDQEIGRLDIAMDDTVMMGMSQRLGRLQTHLGDPAEVGRAARRFERRQSLFELLTGDRRGWGRQPGTRYRARRGRRPQL